MENSARLEAVKLAIVQGYFDRARALLEETPAVPRSEPAAAMLWGRVLRWQHRFEESAAAFAHAAAAAPAAVEPRLLRAESLLNIGRVAEVLKALNEAERNCPLPKKDDIPGWLERYRLRVCALDYERAAEAGELVLDLTRRSELLEALHWPIFTEEFDLTPRPPDYIARALKKLDPLVSSKAKLPWILYFRALMGDYDPSRRAQTRADLEALKAFPPRRYGWMRLKLAQTLYGERDFRAAAAEFSVAAAASEPGQWKALAMAAECFCRLGNREGCLRIARGLELLSPPRQARHSDFGECWAVKGRLLLWLGLYEEALTALETAETHTSYDVPCWKGAALVMLGRCEEAIPSLDRALTFQFTPSFREARLWRAQALLKLGRPREALADCEAAVGDRNLNWHVHLLRALARRACGDAAGMREDFEELPDKVRACVGLRAKKPAEARLSAGLDALLEASLGVRYGFFPPRAPRSSK